MDNFVEAEKSAALAIRYNSTFPWVHVAHADALVGLEQYESARAAMQRVRNLAPHFTLEKILEHISLMVVDPNPRKHVINNTSLAWSD